MQTCMRVCILTRVFSSICMHTCRLEYSGNYCELLMVISDVICTMSTPLCCSVCCAGSQHSSWQCLEQSRTGLCAVPSRIEEGQCVLFPVGEESRCCWLPTHPAGSGRPPGRQLLGLHNRQPAWQYIREELGTFTGETHQKYIEINIFAPNVLIFTCGVFFHQKTHWKVSSFLGFFFPLRFSSRTKAKVIII